MVWPERSSSTNPEVRGAGGGLGSPAYFRSMVATVWRSWASCSVIVIRLLFAPPCSILEHSAQSIVLLRIVHAIAGRAPMPLRGVVGGRGPAACGGAAHAAWRRALPRHLVRQAAAGACNLSALGSADRPGAAHSRRSIRVAGLRAGVCIGGQTLVETRGLRRGGAAWLLSDVRYALGGSATGRGSASSGAASRDCAAGCAPSVLLE